ncbi:MAG: hypothetical protein IKE23_06490, partial [Exiguobacterium sp.]|nr:hypothetical protein [Exiguobacterium sp.]
MSRNTPKPTRNGLNGRTKAQDSKIREIAKRTTELKNEQLRIVNENGEVVLEKKGKAHEVTATVGEKRNAHWSNRNSITIHNHPNGGTFSDADLDEFGYGAKEIVVSAPEATYRLVKTSKGTPDWVGLRDRIREIPEASPMALRREARKIVDGTDVK